MAISPKDRYPGQVDVSDLASYPEGAARNITVPGDGTGTPWEQDLVNDIFGFQQSLLAFAGATPTGVPDKVGASQYMDALALVIDQHGFINLSAIDAAISNDLTVGGDATFDGTVTVDLGATLQCDGSAFFTGFTEFSFPVSFTSSITATSASFTTGNFSGAVTISGLLTAGAGIIVGAAGFINTGPSQFVGNVEIGNPVTLTGDGHIRCRAVVGADAPATYGVDTVDHVQVTMLSADRVYTLSTTGAGEGSEISFTNEDVTWQVTAGGTVIRNASGFARSVEFVFVGGAWRVAHLHHVP